MSLSITNPSYDKVYTAYAWRYNSIFINMTQGEGIEDTGVVWNSDGTINQAATAQTSVTADHVKAPRFQLRDDRGILDLTNCQVVLAVKRPKGTEDLLACYIEGSASDGIISCPITRSATAIEGKGLGEIRVLSNNAVIKFYGIHFNVYKGVSDLAAEQSTQFAALVSALQKVALVNPDGSNTVAMDTEVTENGTNPVASGVIYDFVYSVYNDGSKVSFVETNDPDNATQNGVWYKVHTNSEDYALFAISVNAQQAQFRIKPTGDIFIRRRFKDGDNFPAWGNFEKIGWKESEIKTWIDNRADTLMGNIDAKLALKADLDEVGITHDKISVSMLDVKSYLNFEIGGIDNSGLDTNQQNRIRSEMRSFPFDVTVYHNNKTRFAVFYYKEDRRFDKVEWYEATTSAEIPAETLFRIVSCKRVGFDVISDTVDYCVEYNNIFIYRTDGLYKTIIDNSSAISQLETDVDALETDVDALENNVGVIGEKCDMIPQSAISMLDLKSYLQFEIGGLYDNGSDYNKPDGSPAQHNRIRSKKTTLPFDIVVMQGANHRIKVFTFDPQTEDFEKATEFLVGDDKYVNIDAGTSFRILADNNDVEHIIPNDDFINDGSYNNLFVYRTDGVYKTIYDNDLLIQELIEETGELMDQNDSFSKVISQATISMLDVKSHLQFEIGGIGADGNNFPEQFNRIRSKKMTLPYDIIIRQLTNHRFRVFTFSPQTGKLINDTDFISRPDQIVTVMAGTPFRILAGEDNQNPIEVTLDKSRAFNDLFVYRADGIYKTIADNASAISQLETDLDALVNDVSALEQESDVCLQSAISMVDLKAYLQFEIGGVFDNGKDYNNPDGSPAQHNRIRSKMMTLPYDIIVKQSANHRFRVFKFDSQTEALVSDSRFMIGADKTVTITSGTLFRILADNNDVEHIIPNDDFINDGSYNNLFVYRSDEAGMHTRIERVEYQALANAAAITELSEEKVPMYWRATIDSKVARIRKIMEDAAKLGQRVSTFVLSTDNHYPSHSDVSPILMKYLSENCSISTAINIGDIIEDDGLDITGDRAAESKQLGLNNELYITKRLSSPFNIYLPVQGNHDDNCCLVRGQTPDGKDARFPARIIYNAEWAQMIQGQFSHYDNIEFGESGKYFVYTDKMNKLVYIGLDSMATDNRTTLSEQYGTVNVRPTLFGTDQINWLSNTLNNIPSGYGVIIFTHISPHIFLANNGVAVAGQSTPIDGDSVKALVRSFVNNGGELVGFFTGHFHFDAVNSADGVTYICTMNDGLYSGSNKTGGTAGIGFPDGKERGTVTECAFDVVMVNRSSHHVDIVRVGCGSNERSYNYVVQ